MYTSNQPPTVWTKDLAGQSTNQSWSQCVPAFPWSHHTSLYTSVHIHLSICPPVCLSLSVCLGNPESSHSIPCVQSAHLTHSDSGSTGCQMPRFNWGARLFLNTIKYIVSVRQEAFPTPPLGFFVFNDKIQHVGINTAISCSTYYHKNNKIIISYKSNIIIFVFRNVLILM